MKQALSILLMLLANMLAHAQMQQVFSTAADGYLNVRVEPDANAFVTDVLLTGGDGARLLNKHGNWLHIDYKGQQGYVNARYATIGARPSNVKPLQCKLYYIVVQSFDDISQAKAAADNMPDILASPVYRATDNNGVVKYRVCTGCFLNRQKAQVEQKQLKELGWDSWLWTSTGFAQCVYRPASVYDGSIPIAPLTPRQ